MPFSAVRVALLAVTVAGLVTAGTAIIIALDYRTTTAYNRRVVADIARVVEDNLRRLIDNAEAALALTIAATTAGGGTVDLRDREAWMLVRAVLDPVIGNQDLWIARSDGRIITHSTDPGAPAVNVADRAYFAAARASGSLFVGPAVSSRFTGDTVLTFSRGIFGPDGSFDGVAGIDIEADWLITFYALLESELQPDIGVFRGDGSVVVVNRDLAALMGTRIQDSPAWRDLFAGTEPDDGLTARLVVPDHDLVIITRLDSGRAMARWNARAVNTTIVAGFGAAALVAVFLLAFTAIRREHAIAVQLAETTARLETARRDTLTGLAGRGLFHDRAHHLIDDAARADHAVGMLYLDLDGFKQVNDRLGHDRGDEVLVETARGIARAVRDTDVPARLGGDEFAVCLAARPDTIDRTLADAADRILAAVAAIGDGIACSIGTATADGAAAGLDDLLRRAETAMRRAKAGGKNRVVSG